MLHISVTTIDPSTPELIPITDCNQLHAHCNNTQKLLYGRYRSAHTSMTRTHQLHRHPALSLQSKSRQQTILALTVTTTQQVTSITPTPTTSLPPMKVRKHRLTSLLHHHLCRHHCPRSLTLLTSMMMISITMLPPSLLMLPLPPRHILQLFPQLSPLTLHVPSVRLLVATNFQPKRNILLATSSFVGITARPRAGQDLFPQLHLSMLTPHHLHPPCQYLPHRTLNRLVQNFPGNSSRPLTFQSTTSPIMPEHHHFQLPRSISPHASPAHVVHVPHMHTPKVFTLHYTTLSNSMSLCVVNPTRYPPSQTLTSLAIATHQQHCRQSYMLSATLSITRDPTAHTRIVHTTLEI